MTTKPGTLRKRSVTAARRSLTLIRDAAIRHLEQLEAGETPSDTFAVSVLKYEESLAVLQALDQLEDGGGANPDAGEGTVEVSLEALTGLIGLLRASDVGYAIQDAEDGSPLGDLVALAGTGEEPS